jgi:GDP-L-fucose synthase
MKNKILVTGGTGLVGSAIKELVYSDSDVVFVGSKDYNLIDRTETKKMFQEIKPTQVIHLAAKVGGLKANMDNLGAMYTDNAYINTNVLEEARIAGVEKLVSVLSTCVYPAQAILPLTEDQLHSGPPHHTNYGYSFIKRGLDVQSRMYRAQYGCNFVTVIPTNLFGKNDNFDSNDSHVLPAIIRKIYEAKLAEEKEITFWGTGESLREFLYAKDFAAILLNVLESYNDENPLNVGTAMEISIKNVVSLICKIMDYDGEVIWDNTSSSGIYRKPSSNKKLLLQNWWKQDFFTDLEDALQQTTDWFCMNYPNIRGIKR